MNLVKVLVSSHSGSQIINSLEHPDELDHLDNLDHLDHLVHLDHPDQLNHSDKSQPRLIKQFIKIDAEFVYLVLLLVGFRDMIFHTYFFRPGGWRDDDTGGRDLASSERKLKDRVSALQVTLVLVLGVGVAI